MISRTLSLLAKRRRAYLIKKYQKATPKRSSTAITAKTTNTGLVVNVI